VSFLIARLYNSSGGYLGPLPAWSALGGGQQMNDSDTGSVTILFDNPVLRDTPAMLDYGNLVKIGVGHDDPPVACFAIQKKTLVLLDTETGQVPAITLAGNGVGDWFRGMAVYPEGGLNRLAHADRTFSWTTQLTGRWYDPAQWHKAVSTGPYGKTHPWVGNPTGFPAASAQWIWDRSNGPLGVPQGEVYFRASFNLPAAGTVTVWASIDNYGEVYVDGQQVCQMAADSGWDWSQIATGSLELPAGLHTIAVRAENVNLSTSGTAGAGGLLLAAGLANSAGALTKLLRVSDESWVCLPYPTAYPGWSIGDVWRQLLAEADQRGAYGAHIIPLGFTPDADSAGKPWGDVLDWPLSVGDQYRDFLDTTAAVADWSFDPDTLRFDLWQHRGTDRTIDNPAGDPVILRPLRNVTKAGSEGSFDPVNTLLVNTSDGYHEIRETGTSAAQFGRREGFLSATDQNQALAGKLAEQAFTDQAYPSSAPTVEFIALPGAVPFRDFGVGDTILAPADTFDLTSPLTPRRVVSLSVEADGDTGEPRYTAELETITKDRSDRLARWLKSIGHGTLGGIIAAAGRRPTPAALARQAGSYPTGGALGVRTTAGYTTPSLAAGGIQQDTIVLSGSYVIYRLTVTGPCRIRLYASLAQQAADVNRDSATAPAGDHGVLLDLTLGQAGTRTLTPALTGASLDTPPSVNIPITVSNTAAGPAAVTVTADYMATG
jgi:hypothetical protein